MRKILLFFSLIVIVSCDKNDDANSDGSKTDEAFLWVPRLIGFINDKQVELNWYNYIGFYKMMIIPYNYVDPDKFEIYQSSETVHDFKKMIEIDFNGENEYIVKNLKNNKPYYYYILSKKKGYHSLSSDTIMVIPNPMSELTTLISTDYLHTVTSVSTAPEIDKIAYVDKYYQWNGGDNCCSSVSVLISNTDGSDSKLVEINGYDPDWSPDNNKIVYRTENREFNNGYGIPSQIALYDYTSDKIKKLTTDTAYNYSPVFSKDGSLVLYQSNKNGPDIYSTSLKLINLQTLEINQIADLSDINMANGLKPNWIDNEAFLFQLTDRNYITHICQSSIKTKELTIVINSQWNDFCPASSPDKNKIAFISNRSGSNQVWLYCPNTKTYKQLTGHLKEDYIDETWNKIDWTDNSNIIFNIGDNRLVKLKVE
jgi:Tol biopolymer transport system component